MFLVYGLFKPSLTLELGINTLKEKGFDRNRLTVVTLDPCLPKEQTILDSMYKTDGMSMVDGIAMSASVGMLLGVIYGTKIHIGSVALGLIGMVVGGIIGYILDKRIRKNKQPKYDFTPGEIIVIVECNNKEEAKEAEGIMKQHRANALGRSLL